MKTLVFLGSPKRHGESGSVVDALLDSLQGEVKVIKVMDETIKPCLDCHHCFKEDDCSQEDSFHEVLEEIDAADCIVIASPMWFGTISGPLLSYLSRLQIRYAQYEVKKNRKHLWNTCGIFIMTSGAQWEYMSKSVEVCVESFFKQMDTVLLDTIYCNSSDTISSLKNTISMEKTKYIGSRIQDWYHRKQTNQFIQYGYTSSNYIEEEEIYEG